MRKLAFLSVFAYVFTVPWEFTLELGGSAGSLTRVVAIAALLIGVIAVVLTNRIRPIVSIHVLVLLFLGFVCATIFWTADWKLTAASIRTYIQGMWVIWLIWEYASDPKSQVRLITAYVLGAWVSVINTFVNFATVGVKYGAGEVRYKATGWNENELAIVLSLAIPLAAYAGVAERNKFLAWCCRGYLIAAPVAVALTASRGGAVVAFVALICSLFIGFKDWSSRTITIAVLAIACIVAYKFIPEKSWERLATMTHDVDWDYRIPIWHSGLRTFQEHPFIGVGAGAFLPAVKVQFVAHNTFLSILVEEGLAGFLIFMSLLFGLFRIAFFMPVLERRLWIAMLLCWGIGVSSATWEQSRTTWLIFGLLIAQGYPMYIEKRREKQVAAAHPDVGSSLVTSSH